MLSSTRSRIPALAFRITQTTFRTLSTSSTRLSDQTPVPKPNEVEIDAKGSQDKALLEKIAESEKQIQLQAPNRAGIWSRSQMPKDLAMSGPRFEQTIIQLQPQPFSAMDLIHKQPVRWVHDKVVACDGGGGPLGHPKIFINTDKPQICQCTYCGLPYANEHHKKYLKSLPSTPYPLEPTGDPDEVAMPSTLSQMSEVQGTRPHLVGELKAEEVDGQPFTQR